MADRGDEVVQEVAPSLKRVFLDEVETVVEQLRDPAKVAYWTNQSATLHPNDARKACEATLYEAWTDFLDDLSIPLAVTLATFGIDAEGNGQ